MNYQFSFRHMDVSDALKDFAEKKLEKSLAHMTEIPHRVHMVFEEEVGSISVRCDVSASGHHDFHVSHVSENAYESVDKAILKLENQFKKVKPDRRRSKLNKSERWDFLQPDEEPETELDSI